ncbi:unnamed protein product [Polarella glacialis]|uniref:YEATS domain-containing protein n=1 Tax=Polarella glacialis TaxID=89957 RepID=A0A813L1L0_POLGL|nr:unnamed protein product [Polarella glacialis]
MAAATAPVEGFGDTGCQIEHCEERGISPAQLLVVWKHTLAQAHEWRDSFKSSPTFGQPLKAEDVNLYQLCENLLKPATSQRKCSFVEILAVAPQTPRFFMSHWWGEPVGLFISCITAHQLLRHLEKTSPYWVCAYANNQWDLESDVTADPAESSFRKAMALADGLLSIIDADAVTFGRVWCVYEIAVTFGDHKLYDIATVAAGKPVIIADGLTPHDIAEGEQYGPDYQGGSRGYKSRREEHFPLQLCQKALEVKVENAEASVASGRIHILNSIAGLKDLDGEPPAEHPGYAHTNHVLHGRFAAAIYRPALENASKLCGGMPGKLQRALSCYPCQELVLSFFECENLDHGSLAGLISAMPDCLESLELDFTSCNTLVSPSCRESDEGPGSPPLSELSGFAHLSLLKSLNLDFSRCWYMTDLDIFESFEGLVSLTDLWVDFSMCQRLRDISGFQKLETLPALRTASADFSSCSALADRSMLCLPHGAKKLQSLSLNFSGSSISHAQLLGQCPPSLAHLNINCVRCLQMAELPVLKGIGDAPNLKSLVLDFSLCENLKDISSLGDLARLPEDIELSLKFLGCRAVGATHSDICSMAQLRTLKLTAPSSSRSGSILRRLGTGIASLTVRPNAKAKVHPVQEHKLGLIFVGNTAKPVPGKADAKASVSKARRPERTKWSWTFYVRGDTDAIRNVTITLHPTFAIPVVKLKGPVYESTATGWGTFAIEVVICWKTGGELRTTWELQFDADASKPFKVPELPMA